MRYACYTLSDAKRARPYIAKATCRAKKKKACFIAVVSRCSRAIFDYNLDIVLNIALSDGYGDKAWGGGGGFRG